MTTTLSLAGMAAAMAAAVVTAMTPGTVPLPGPAALAFAADMAAAMTAAVGAAVFGGDGHGAITEEKGQGQCRQAETKISPMSFLCAHQHVLPPDPILKR